MATIADMTVAVREALASQGQSVASESATSLPQTAYEPSASLPHDDDMVRLSPSLNDITAQRTKDVSDSLVAGFKAAKVDVSSDVRLSIDASGRITATDTSRAQSEKIEQFFQDDPRMAQELKEVAAMNALMAQQEVKAQYEKEKREAEAISDPEERQEAIRKAEIRRLTRIATTGEVSGALTLQKKALSSAALDFARSLSSL